MATKYDGQIAGLQKEADIYQAKLDSSATAFGGDQPATDSEIGDQVKLQSLRDQMQRVRDKGIQEKWFGPETDQPTSEGVKQGFVGKALTTLSRPLYGIVGAAESVFGKGAKKDILSNVQENISEGHRTFGDLLKRSNVPYPISAPLGFALDVAFDPVNWATAGAAALLPRTVLGLAKGTTKGATSSLLGKAAFVGKYVPGLKSTKGFQKVADLAASETGAFNKLVGRDIETMIQKTGVPIGGSKYRATLGDMAQLAAERVPGGAAFMRAFSYSNKDWIRLNRIKDTLEQALGLGDELNAALKAYAKGEPIEPYLLAARRKMSAEKPFGEGVPGILDDVADTVPSIGSETDDVIQMLRGKSEVKSAAQSLSDTMDILQNPSSYVSGDTIENALRLGGEALETTITLDDIARITKAMPLDETGVQWYDNLTNSINNFKYTVKTKNGDKVYEVGKNALEKYQTFINIFKRAKVGASPSAWMNAIIGNPTMAWMAGINILDPKYMGRLKNGASFTLGGKQTNAVLSEFFNLSEMARIMKEEPTTFMKTFGISPKYMSQRYLVERALRAGRDAGIIGKNIDKEALTKSLMDAVDDMNTHLMDTAAQEANLKILGKSAREIVPSPIESAKEIMKQGKDFGAFDLPASFGSNELLNSRMANELFTKLETRAAAPNANPGYKLLNLLFNKSIAAYDNIDQTYKLATSLYLTLDGVTEAELNTLRRLVQFGPQDIVSKYNDLGTLRYRISGGKTLELVNEIYLNYGAMPPAIRVLRNIPLVGSPFASFSFGMLLKTANAAVYNPAVFNKVSFALNDFGGQQSPLEKRAVSDSSRNPATGKPYTQYYNYLDKPGMFRVPFFDENPLYVNMSNILPYYSFNMFTPSERKYADLYPNKLVEYIDKTPFLKDPVGSTIFDYLIQPLIIKNAIPVGSFGQPLYPYQAGAVKKSLYALRNLSEAVIPGVVAPVAGAFHGLSTLGGTGVSIEAAPSYRWRQMARAMRGENPYGKSGKEPAWQRVSRTVAATLGIPVQAPVNLRYTQKSDAK